MKLEQLRVLQAIVTAGTFRGAAAILHKSQPALSQMLKTLEEEIGVTLLSREGYRPTLTPAGEVFYRQANLVLEQVQELGHLAEQLAAHQEPKVVLAVTATCPLAPLLAVVSRIGQCFPATHIRLSTEAMGGAAERLMNGEADIVISTMDGLSADSVEALSYTTVTIVPVARPDYGPARIPGQISNAQMRTFVQVILAGTGDGAFEQSRDVLPDGLRWTVSDMAAKKEVILAGMGWGGLPEHLVRGEILSGDLVPLDLAGFPVRCSQLHLIRQRSRSTGVVANTIWGALQTPLDMDVPQPASQTER
ncbi:LysR family transcriptional regulator [Halomonas sp. ANAO-440]|uniref:LysR family transcriptional regulator n=1 Tax=Halomonas sp. ANAO-440 TaxID=2861360 RepID=UPI001CAA4A21|nr:LysR family transcriptional regulator [Halomonas sp. ANAO-440]MBZ0331394.1 LysR family transcriptional regulator [Halomonas sp. ANAO-440]